MSATIRVMTHLIVAMIAFASLVFTPPKEWKPVAVSSSMRVAQFALPKAAGDPQDGELVVYYFGGSGGSVEANIERWVGQMRQPDGRPSTAVMKRATRTINGLKVTTVDVSGTYVAEIMPGSAEHHNNPGFRLRAAVIETIDGPYFVKLTGPAKTIAANDEQFEAYLSSVKYTK